MDASLRCLLLLTTSVALVGCGKTEPLPPATERFFFVAEGLAPPTRHATYQAVTETIRRVARPGEYVTIVSTPGHTPIATLCVPNGSEKTRLKKPAIRHEVRTIAEFFERENAGGSLQAESPKIASTVRALRRTDLPVRVVVVADPVYRNDRHETWSMVEGGVPCDGAITQEGSPWRVVQTFPENTSVGWLTPEADFGDGLFHQEAITRWHRRYLLACGASLDCLTPDPAVAFGYKGTQFTSPLGHLDDAIGMRRVTGVADTRPVEPAPIEPKPSEPALVEPAPEQTAVAPPLDVYDAAPPSLEALRGDLRHVVFLRDLSRSMIQDAEGNPLPAINEAVVADLCEKLMSVRSVRFSVVGFGGRGSTGEDVRLKRFPWSLWGPAWSPSSEEQREAACRAVTGWEAEGGTSTYAALKEAQRLEGLTTIVLWSDGLPSISEGEDAQREVLDLVDQLAAQGVVINTIGVGALSVRGGGQLDLEGAEFLRRIAAVTGGAYLAL